MGKTRKGLVAGGIAVATATALLYDQAGAKHAPTAFPAPPLITATATAAPVQTPVEPANKSSARPLKNLRVKIPAARLRLSPAVEQTSYARLAIGPISYLDGALRLPGRIEPETFKPDKVDATEVGHSVSAPTALREPDSFDALRGDKNRWTMGQTAPVHAGLALIPSAHAANASSGGKALGGPLSRMPINGHILFAMGSEILTAEAQTQLDRLVEMLRDSHAALEVVAYGGNPKSGRGEARRLALRRGLAVRSYLASRGIDQARISVRPMGNVRGGGPQARADVFYAVY